MATRKNYIKQSDSKDSLRTYTWNKDIATVYPDFSYQLVVNMVDDDPIARGAINHFVDKCMEGNYSILNRTTKKVDLDEEDRLQEKYQFRTEILRKIFLQGKMFNQAFVENVKITGNQVKALNVLDTMNVDPITKPNGDPIKYRSKQPHPVTGKYPEWTTEEITWIKFGDRSTGFAPLDFKALYENLCMKSWIKRYVGWLWKTGQYRLLYNFKNASSADVEDFLAYGRRNDDNFRVPFVMKGEMESKLLRDMKEQESIELFLKYLDGQTLILLRIPPIDAGIPDASGRSNSDAQSNNLGTTITSAKKIVEDKINFDLFTKMNKGNKLIKFAPNDRFAVKQVFENVQMMQSMNFTDEAMEEYMGDTGIFFKSKLFKKPEPMMMGTSANPRSLDNMPSRTGKGVGEANKNIGTGAESTTRPNQLKKQ